MKNCGRRFHNEVGKYRFLNELIKVVSPKVRSTNRLKIKSRLTVCPTIQPLLNHFLFPVHGRQCIRESEVEDSRDAVQLDRGVP